MATPYDMRPRVDPSAISKPQQAGLPGQPPPAGAGPQQGPAAPQTQAQSPGQPPQGGMSQAAGQSRFAGTVAQSAAPRNSAPIKPQPMPASTAPQAQNASYWDRSGGHARNVGGSPGVTTYAKAVAPGQVQTTLPYGLSNQIGWANAVAGQHVNFAEPEVAAAPDGVPEGTPDGAVPPSDGSKGNAARGKKSGPATGSTGQGLDPGTPPDNGSGGVVTASASAQDQGPPQTGSAVSQEFINNLGGQAVHGEVDGMESYYDPKTGTTYKSDGGDPPTWTVVVDKKGYGADGKPFTGDAMEHPAVGPDGNPVRGPHGEPVGQNSENHTYWYLDEGGNAIQVNAQGQPLDGGGKVQVGADGKPVAGGGQSTEGAKWDKIVQDLLNEQAPQQSEADIQGVIDADRKRQAYEQSQAIALQMGLSGNMSSEQFGSNLGKTATEFGTQGAQREAATRLQLKMQNIEGQMQQYQNKVQTLRNMAAQQSDKEMAGRAFAAAAAVESRQMAMQMEYAKFQRELNKMNFGEGLLSVFSGILGGAANAGISRLIGGK